MQESISNLLKQWNLSEWQWNLILVGIIVVFGIVTFLVMKLLAVKRREDTVHFNVFRSLAEHLSKPVSVFLPLFFLDMLLPAFKESKVIISRIDKAIEISLIICFAWILLKLIAVIQDWVYHQYDITKANNLHERKIRTQLLYVKRIAVTLISLVTIAIILLSFDNLRTVGSSLLTGVGLGGLIIGFAAQKSLGNFLAGFQIAFTQPFRIDDVLIVEGEYGKVDEITLTYVVLKLWDERRLILPINYFIEKPFQNWTRINAQLLGTVEIYADYSVPVHEIRAELRRILEEHQLWDKRVIALQVTDAKERTITLRALMSSSNSADLFTLRCDVREALISFISTNYPDGLPKLRTEINNAGKDQPAINEA